MSERGYVYILSNDSMPGVVKIGQSKIGGKERAKALNTTGVPNPFVLEFEIYVEDYQLLEKQMHVYLDKHRVRPNREFFKISVSRAKSELISWYLRWSEMVVADRCEILDSYFFQPLEYVLETEFDVTCEYPNELVEAFHYGFSECPDMAVKCINLHREYNKEADKRLNKVVPIKGGKDA